MHKRTFPKVNQFTYGVYYLALPLDQLDNADIPLNRFGLQSFYHKDHGAKDSSNLESWMRNILKEHHLNDAVSDIILICMPRVLGYLFNPVSFWLCLDKEHNLRAVLSEVNNTFGETHNYLCLPTEGKSIDKTKWITAEKLFHVSPFLKREGTYQFRFALEGNHLGIWIDYYDKANNKQLLTSLVGELHPLTKRSLRRAFIKHPLITLKTITLIHWQAIKLMRKGIRYITKPKQKKQRFSVSHK